MTTTLRELRRGLPREAGGEPWPPAGVFVVEDRPSWLAETAGSVAAAAPVPAPAPAVDVPVAAAPVAARASAVETSSDTEERRVPLRRGLPRAMGAEPWPPAGSGVLVARVGDFLAGGSSAPVEAVAPAAAETPAPAGATAPAAASVTIANAPTETRRIPLRRGLPRTAQGEAWPPAGEGVLTVRVVEDVVPTAPAPVAALVSERAETPVVVPASASAVTPKQAAVTKQAAVPKQAAVAPADRPSVLATIGGLAQRAIGFPALLFVAGVVVLGLLVMLAMWFRGTGAGAAFVGRFPGTYALPASAEPGFPAWVRWNHFLNLFFVILIIRSGLQVRHEKKPPAYWTPRWSGAGGKVSISLWLHQTLDLLWLLNGLTFVTLLFVTTHWMRLVPTSWEVFPNALSAALQYLSLDWPVENGWVAYNSLQQLSYFVVVFVAAPLAAATGFRMSGLWPSKATKLSAAYPLELARALHFPTMLFFVVFVVGHVTMVFATGARKNLNHMFVGNDGTSWAGFWVFVLGLAVVAVVWELARPLLIAPVANLTGKVSQR